MEDKENFYPKTRSDKTAFNWKVQCFICGEKCDPKRDFTKTCRGFSRSWSYVENSVSTDAKSTYSKVLEIAKLRQDHEILDRLSSLPNGDLVAVQAKYHRKKCCLAKYYSNSLLESNSRQTTSKSVHRVAAEILKQEYQSSIMTDKKVFYLSTLRKRFVEIAKESGRSDAENYKSADLKKLLSDLWPELRFVSKQGTSDLVCSSSKTLEETLQETKQLEGAIEESCSYAGDVKREEETDESIVHKAIGVLRRRILSYTERIDNEFFSPEEMSLSSQKGFVDPLLYKAVCWLSDVNLFKKASEVVNKRNIAIACDLTTLVSSISSPKHLGLAVHLYNEFGSRHLIDDMFNLGYAISYSELRMFLSAAANQAVELKQTTSSGGLVPEHLSKENDGNLIVAVCDNWDHNERTVDGKRTTHAMTSILVCNKSPDDNGIPRLQKTPNRTFDSNVLPGGGLCSIVPYIKPVHRASPYFDPPVTVDDIKPHIPHTAQVAILKELLYVFGRSSVFYDDISDEKPSFPHWNIFHANSEREDQSQSTSNIIYNPILMANPTDYSTIYTTLLRTKEVMNALGQKYIPIVFDMGLLTKALQIVWANPDILDGVIPIEGGMHLLMSVFSGIGYLYGEAGLRQILSDSGLYAPATVTNILAGKDFDRAMMAYKVIDEALNRRLLDNFEMWCEENNKEIHSTVNDVLLKLRNIGNNPLTDHDLIKFCDVLSAQIVPLIDEFKEECRQISPTFKLWDDYLTNVSTPLKLLISSTRSPDWQTHQYAKLSLMPLLFASNRTNYAKYMTVQLLQMYRLPKEVEDKFIEGSFTAKLSTNKFSSVWMDYTLEVTQNKALKGSGGIIGLTLRENALARWVLARPLSSIYSSVFHRSISSANNEDCNHAHHSDTKAKREQYDKSVNKLITMFDGIFIDPFNVKNTPSKLINIASGVLATDEVEKSMLDCMDTGMKMFESFVSERLVRKPDGTDPPKKNMFDPLPRSSVKTMSVGPSKTGRKVKTTQNISSEVMFQRLLAVNTYKKVPLDRLFSYENTYVPVSFFSENGSMHKNKKSDFMTKLEDLLPSRSTDIQENADAIIFDGMAIVQILPSHSEYNTFKDMASAFLRYILLKTRSIQGVKTMHIVFDKYSEQSMKTQTRIARGDNRTSDCLHVHNKLIIPKDWKMFLTNGKNKENLVKFYSAYMIENASSELYEDEVLIINGAKDLDCTHISTSECKALSVLNSNHEEADTLVILHAKYAADTGCCSLVVQSPDTDVLVLLIHHFSNIGVKNLNMMTGRLTSHTNLRRFIPVHHLVQLLTKDQLNVILTVYCLTGCDTTSSFYGKGKKKIFNQMIKWASKYNGLSHMGEEIYMTEEHRMACIKFFVNLYGGDDTQSLKDVRCKKALQGTYPRNLPPTEDSFSLHCLRCVLQLWIWRHATIAHHCLPPFTDFGFEYEDGPSGGIKPKLMKQAVAAPELLNDMVCYCNICSENCCCFLNQQPCTSACNCTANTHTEDLVCAYVYTLSAIYSLDEIECSDIEDN